MGLHDLLDLGLASITGASRTGVPKGVKWAGAGIAVVGAVVGVAIAWKEGDVTHVGPPSPSEGYVREHLFERAVELEHMLNWMRERPGGVPGPYPGIAGHERRAYIRTQAELAAILTELGWASEGQR